MFTSQAKKNIRQLDDEIGALLDALNGMSITDDLYEPTHKKIVDLYKIKAESAKNSSITSRDYLSAAVTIGSILTVTLFEASGHTIASKALAFVRKP